jgi:hypothetical protein
LRPAVATRIAAATGAIALALPGAALAAAPSANPFGPVPQAQSTTPATPAPTAPPSGATPTPGAVQTPGATSQVPVTPGTSGSTGGGLSGTDALLIALGAVIVLGGISFYIWRDARKRAPARAVAATAGVGSRSGSKPRPKPRKLSPAERRRRKRGRAR